MEILDIKSCLDKIGGSGIVSDDTKEACQQAGELLGAFRQTVLGNPRASPSEIVEKLREVLAQQGEG